MATTRFDIQLDEGIKVKAEKASVLPGMGSLTEYVVGLIAQMYPGLFLSMKISPSMMMSLNGLSWPVSRNRLSFDRGEIELQL